MSSTRIRVTAVIAMAAATLGTSVALAPTAFAALATPGTVNMGGSNTYGCAASVNIFSGSSTVTSIVGSAGDTLTLAKVASVCTDFGVEWLDASNAVISSTLGVTNFAPTSVTIPVGATQARFVYDGTTPIPSGTVPILGSAPAPAANDDVAQPLPVLQQFAAPTSGTCMDAASRSLDWAGVPGTGWGQSWAQWPDGGRGGSVCTRTLIWSSGLGHWVVA